MDYQVSARKYRPGTFDDVIGQSHVVQTLMNAIATKRRLPMRFVFRYAGMGKRRSPAFWRRRSIVSRANGFPCNTCVGVGNHAGVRRWMSSKSMGPRTPASTMCGKFARTSNSRRSADSIVYIIDEVHMLSNSAFNAPVEDAGRTSVSCGVHLRYHGNS